METTDQIFTSHSTNERTFRSSSSPRIFVPRRYIITAFIFVGFVNMYYLRTNLSVAIIEMTSNKNITAKNITYTQEAEFHWNSKEIGIVLSSFAYGCIFAPLGGLLSVKYGGATIFGFGIGLTALLTVLTPLMLHFPLYIYLLVRLFEGILESASMTSCVELLAHWSPPEERSRLMVLSNVGMFFGITLNYPVSGYVAKVYNWKAVFYVSGGFTLIWYFFWLLFVSNDPSEDRFISEVEKSFLKEKTKYITKEKVIYPWMKILTSKPVWAFFAVKFVLAWGYSFTALCLPLYIKDMQDVDINNIGLITSIPNFCALISQPSGAYLTDYFRKKKTITISKVHRLLICFGCVSGTITFSIIASWTNFTGSIVLLSVFRLLIGFTEASVAVLPLEIATRYASLLQGVALTFYSLGVILNPTVLGFVVTNHTMSEWRTYFFCIAGLNMFAGIVFLVFGSGEHQSWAFSSKYVECKFRNKEPSQ